jgi:hypothetical protein
LWCSVASRCLIATAPKRPISNTFTRLH